MYICIYICICFLSHVGTPKSSLFIAILGYPHLWKSPYIYIFNYIYTVLLPMV